MKDYGCDRVYVEGFKENPGSFFGWIYFTITLCFMAFVSYFFIPALSIVFIALGLLLCVLQFGLYKKIVDKFFKEKTGHNAAGFKKPTGEVKRRIIFNGHPDAAWEWPFKYKFTYLGFDIHMLTCFIGAFYLLAISIVRLTGAISDDLARTLGLIALVFVPFWFGLYFMWNSKRVVDGANDNLTGCYIGMAILKMLKDEGIEFENTEVGVILSGSEEAGLRGAKAWCEAHKDEFNDVPTFIYSYDTIAQSEHLSINYRDLNGTVKVDKDVSDLFYEACQELDIPCGKGMVPPLGGATDSAAFAQAGMRATGITALNHALPDFYHTRLDTPEALNKSCLADCFAASVKVLEMFDNGAKQ
ncbi:MAG: M20/M25/M40 family metallo-hydrolase [Clostridia bacterium]|nr:M20/M25/M40 family metallo-hydrolase [Clostridia bacterium]